MFEFRLNDVNCRLLVLLFLSGLGRVSAQVEVAPRVTWGRESQDRIIIREIRTMNYMINCTAEGYPPPTFQWRKDDQILGETGEYIKAFRNGTLYFKNFDSRENGLYQCVATNPLGTSLSDKIPLVREKPPGAIPEDDPSIPKEVPSAVGQPATLQCAKTPPTVPEYVRRWYFEKDTVQLELTDTIGTDAEGNLRFAYVELKDENTYVCALAPRVAHGQDHIQMYNKVRLQVLPGNLVPIEPKLEFSTGGGSTKAYLNRNATLECYFSGYPLPSITWKNTSNHVITSDNRRFLLDDFDHKLIILSVLPEDEGGFSCTASNGHGERTQFINVNVTSRPLKVANQGLSSLIKPERSDVVLRCQAKAASGESMDMPVWYRNGQLLVEANLPDPARYSYGADRTQLYIRNLTKTVDTACFQCNVTNSEGYAFYDGSLTVIDSILIFRQPNAENEITADDALDITVDATGDKCCLINYLWYFNDRELTVDELQTPPFVRDSSTGALIFNATTVSKDTLASWFGKYKCRVSNNYQDVNVEFSISEKGVPAPRAAEVEFELWWIAIIIAVLLIIIIILIIFCCLKRNYPRETYQLEKTELKHHLNPKEELLNKSFQEV